MTTGIEIGPYAILIAVAAFLLKAWWDHNARLNAKRDEVYFKLLKSVENQHYLIKHVRDINMLEENQKILRESGIEILIYGSDAVLEIGAKLVNASTSFMAAVNAEAGAPSEEAAEKEFSRLFNLASKQIRKEIAALHLHNFVFSRKYMIDPPKRDGEAQK